MNWPSFGSKTNSQSSRSRSGGPAALSAHNVTLRWNEPFVVPIFFFRAAIVRASDATPRAQMLHFGSSSSSSVTTISLAFRLRFDRRTVFVTR